MRRAHRWVVIVAAGGRVGVVLAAATAAAVLAACQESKSMAPAPTPNPALTGAWGTVSSSGSFVEFRLRAAGGAITGAGREFRSASFYDSLAISGEYSDTAAFRLTIAYTNGDTAHYTGVALTPTLMVGTWSSGPFDYGPFDRDFYVRPQAPCADSAPLSGKPDPRAPDYIVMYYRSVDSPTETARLAALYHFTPQFVWTHAIEGFSADLLPTTSSLVRCDTLVELMEYDAVGGFEN